jgi:type IV pilus assembly protein PilC
MVRAGEFGGSLSEVTERIASYLEASAALRRRIIAAIMYPLIITVLASALTTCMLIFIVPTFEEIYNDFDAELPKPTQVLILISNLIRHQAPWVIGTLVVLAILFFQIRKSEKGGLVIDRGFLHFPVFGSLIEKIALARFARTFASLMRSGVPILRSVEIVSMATGNRYIGRALTTCAPEIEGGSNIATAMRKTKTFPPMVIHMVSVGEKTGNIDGMLEKIADFYEDEVANALEALSSMIEPLLMAVLGVVIGAIVIAMFMPIFNLHQLIAN